MSVEVLDGIMVVVLWSSDASLLAKSMMAKSMIEDQPVWTSGDLPIAFAASTFLD
jgi:hypothetical protein